MKTARELTKAESQDLIMYGRKLLFAKVIGPGCHLCGKVASDVVVVRNVGLSTNMEFIPACEECKLEDIDKILIEEESA